jgi:hypothetical protein
MMITDEITGQLIIWTILLQTKGGQTVIEMVIGDAKVPGMLALLTKCLHPCWATVRRSFGPLRLDRETIVFGKENRTRLC